MPSPPLYFLFSISLGVPSLVVKMFYYYVEGWVDTAIP